MWIVAAFVFVRRPRDLAAQMLAVIAFLLPFGATATPFGMPVIDVALGPRMWPFLIGEVAFALTWGAVLRFTMVFPRPVEPPRLRALVVVTTFALPFLLHGLWVLARAPSHRLLWWLQMWLGVSDDRPLEWWAVVAPISVEASLVVPILAAAVVTVQYRRTADADDRRRFRWVIYSLLLSAVTYLALGQGPDRLLGEPLVPYELIAVVFLTLPAMLGAAVLRYGVFDLQLVLRRSLVYAVLPLVAVLGPAALAFGLSQWLADEASLTWTLIAALAGATMYQSLRRPVERRVIRLVFGARDDPYEVVAQLGGQLQGKTPVESVLRTTAETVAKTLRLDYVGIELNGVDGVVDVQEYGVLSGRLLAVPLTHQGEEVGRLLLDTGTRLEPFGPADRRLITTLAQQVGSAAHGALLAARLQRSLERAVSVREEERRRLRRDIHDGLGPTLASVRMQLQAVQRMIDRDPARAKRGLEEVAETQKEIQADMRRLVEGLRPPVLDQLGLVEAIRLHMTRFQNGAREGGVDLDMRLEVDDAFGELSAAGEVAAYHIVLEALTNVARHANADTCTVRLWRSAGLRIEVTDNGRGLPEHYRAGIGLSSMRERATEVGGSCAIEHGVDGGTRVTAVLPG
jgi:signal transduction histidine kinase